MLYLKNIYKHNNVNKMFKLCCIFKYIVYICSGFKNINIKIMARATHVKKAQKNIPNTDIKKGDSYYWWKFRFGSKHYSKTAPRRSQLTQSGFLSSLYELEDRISDFTCDNKDDFDSFKEDIASEIESMKDDCQNSLDNMPEHLQESSSSGETLRERIENLESWQSEVESVECEEYEADSIREEILSDYEKEEGESDDDYNERIDEEVANKIQEIVDEAISALQETSSNC